MSLADGARNLIKTIQNAEAKIKAIEGDFSNSEEKIKKFKRSPRKAAPTGNGNNKGTAAAPVGNSNNKGTASAASAAPAGNGNNKGTAAAPAGNGNNKGTAAAPAGNGNNKGTAAAPVGTSNNKGTAAPANSGSAAAVVEKPPAETPSKNYKGDWYAIINDDAIHGGKLEDFKKAVPTKAVADTYVNATLSKQSFTPALYLAKISPKSAHEMLSYLLEIDADLSLLAKTEDCMIRDKCTTIGNLASWSWQGGLPYKSDAMYQMLTDLNKGTYKGLSDAATDAGQKWKKGNQACITTGLGGKWKPGCGIPGISVISSIRRSARNSILGVTGQVKNSAFFLFKTLSGGTKRKRSNYKRRTFRSYH